MITRTGRARNWVRAPACATLAWSTVCARAEDFPSRPLKLIVPSPPGGGFDVTARIVTDRLSPLLGQPVVVENRSGAGTLVGTEAAARAAPDGYTLLLGTFSNFGLNSGLFPKIAYDPIKDFRPISIIVSFPFVLVSRADLPFTDLKATVAGARARPGTITYASAGRGTGQHVAMAALEQFHGISFNHVPYRGAQPAYADIIAGRIDLMFDNVAGMLAQLEGTSLRAMAVSGKSRMPQLPAVPTLIEASGGTLEFESWFGLFAPAATPTAPFERLHDAMTSVVAMPEIGDLFARTGGRMLKLSRGEAESFVKGEVARWTRIVKDAGISAP